MRFATIFAMGLLVSPLSAGEAKKPNILFFFADDMRADVIGALGNAEAQTPNLDRLVKEGLAFTRMHIMGGNQGAVCVPSRAMMLSGKSLFKVSSTLADTPTWPMRLRMAGYRTHFTGKWHNGAPSAQASFPGAKNVFLGGMSNQFAVKLVDLPADKSKKDLSRTTGQHSSELFVDEALRFLKTTDKKEPWALYVAFTSPHDPREAPKQYHAKFDAAKMPIPGNFLPQHPFDNGELNIRDEKLEKFPRTKQAIQQHWADYHAIIAHMDAQIGRLLAELEAQGQLENTIIVFASDNGLALGSHGLMGKQNVYDHSVRVPFVIRGPGIPRDRKTDALAYLIDVCPTLCDLGGALPPYGIEGRSLVPILKGDKAQHRPNLMFAYRDLQRGVRDERWKMIHYPKIDRVQLFDLEQDPLEIRDLSADAAHGETLRRLQGLLMKLQKEFGDK